MFPSADQHPFTGANILCGRGYSDRIIRAIMGHATYTGVARDTPMAKALFATDELCGFLVACALVRPSRSLDDLEVSSVRKKLKDKAFARSVNRQDIYQGVQELGVELDEHIRFVIDALRPVQKEIGLGAREEATGVG
jgi:predicted hydrolase (HD superfamily)